MTSTVNPLVCFWRVKTIRRVENRLIDIRKWAKSNYLKLNDDKTEFVIISTKQQLAKLISQTYATVTLT